MKSFKIKSRFLSKMLFEIEAKSLKIAVEMAVNKKTYLGGADLEGANLGGADLEGADLRGANLRGVKIPPVNDHYFASEILYRKAKTESEKDFAARIRIDLLVCWKALYILAKKKRVVKWVETVLGQWEEYRKKIEEVKKSSGD